MNFDDDIYNTIRRNIKKYRKAKGLTSAQLAEMVGLSHDFMRQLQSDSKKTYNFSVETFYKISVALGISLDRLIEKGKEKYQQGQAEFKAWQEKQKGQSHNNRSASP